ncbi:hypothetical protein [Halochromatium sp.]
MLWAWNPYDADSSWSSPARDDFDTSHHETRDYGWDTGSRASDWGERDRWRDTSNERTGVRENKWREPAPEGYRGEATDGSLWRERQQPWPRESASGWDASRQQRRSTTPGYAPSGVGDYEFRHDPELDTRRPGHQGGWVFRPRTERENARSLADSPYPPIDEQDYLPRGPWRSYQDEGAAFGYHPDQAWPGTSPQLR